MFKLKGLISGVLLAVVFTAVWAAPPQWVNDVPPSSLGDQFYLKVRQVQWSNGAVMDARHAATFGQWKAAFSPNVAVYRLRNVGANINGHHCDQSNVDCESVFVDGLLVSLGERQNLDGWLFLGYFSDDDSVHCSIAYAENGRLGQTMDIPCPTQLTFVPPPKNK